MKTLLIMVREIRLFDGEYSMNTIDLSSVKSGSYLDREAGTRRYVPQIGLVVNLESLQRGTSLLKGGIQMLALNLDDENEGRNSRFRGRQLQPFLDISLLKEWLRSCQEKHDGPCASVLEAKTEFPYRVIDITKRCIVNTPRPCKYVALSYVWGSQAFPQFKLQKSTSDRLLSVLRNILLNFL